MLSDSAKIFDPLGLISCVTIVVKIYFQRLWEQQIQWDDPLHPEIERDWLTWRNGLSQISSLRIPRCYAPLHTNIVSTQLIGFCDASERAYCGIVYLRSVDTAGGVHLSIVIAKTKVAPLKKSKRFHSLVLNFVELNYLHNSSSTPKMCSRSRAAMFVPSPTVT